MNPRSVIRPLFLFRGELYSRSGGMVILCLLLTIVLAGCTSNPRKQSVEEGSASINLHSAFALPATRAVNIEDVPFFPQEKYQCGPAALATVLANQGYEVEPVDLIDRVYLPEQEGTLPLEMVSTGRSYGLMAYKLKPELNHILLQIEAGYPVLVFQNLALESLPQWHFAVIVGYDLDAQELILRSATYREHRVDFETFLNTWDRAERWAYLFLKPGQLPIAADSADYLEASLDLSDVGLNVSAQKALEQGVTQWPEFDEMRLALSNTYFQSGLFDQASDTLLASPSLGRSGQLWNNIAYIQLARQCYSTAFEAVQCAITLSPEDENIRHSLQEILSKSQRPNGEQACPQLNCSKPIEGF